MTTLETDHIRTAAFFVNSTASHIFLTGKAGTGKTTFLRNLATETHKNYVIVAPTGIAALNAGGVTIHSQFQLPLGTFMPDQTPSGNFNDNNSVYTQYTLTRKHPISSARKQVLRAIELLIIDEVSMLRADVLDAIDYRMRSVRGNFAQSFGGVQVLMIGDLYQLPPIVKDHEWNYLKRYYHSAHFFEAKALQTEGFVFIELEKIFRQTDDTFIRVLNNLRNNITTKDDIELLNRHYQDPDKMKADDEIITITTHNYKADDQNRNALSRLPGEAFEFDAEIADEFPENIYPIPKKLILKKGAQIMFVKNDVSGNNKYYNGKLAKVVEVSRDKVFVQLAGTEERYQLENVIWENKRYTVNSTSKELDEDIIGTFTHFPVKLAWAVTVHKSQGLTFDRAVIDVGQAFAPGQVYVALSRLRSLDGLVLRTKIDTKVITSDPLVVEFSSRKNMQPSLEQMLKEKQQIYLNELLTNTFEFQPLVWQISKFMKENDNDVEFEEESMRNTMQLIHASFEGEIENTKKFRYQLKKLLAEKEFNTLAERIVKGTDYYKELLRKNLILLLQHMQVLSKFSGNKTYLSGISELDQVMMKKMDEVEKSGFLISAIIRNEVWNDVAELRSKREVDRKRWIEEAGIVATEKAEKVTRKSGKIRKKVQGKSTKKQKGDTLIETLKLYREGLTIQQIAEKRTLATGTIEGHFSQAIINGDLKAEDWMTREEISLITTALNEQKEVSTKQIFDHFEGKFSYGKIKVAAFLLNPEAEHKA